MMDHNAQVTGRSGDASGSGVGVGIWPPPEMQLPMRDPVAGPPPWYGPRHPHPHPGIAPAPPITKL